jgi:lipoprotein-releasing system permease protein
MIVLFAWRYFKGKKSTQAIQIISWVSVGAMAVGSAALIIVLSVFNGFEGFIKDLYSDFYPQLKITPQVGKTFMPTSQLFIDLKGVKGIKAVSRTLEEKVLFSYNESQVIATLKGIDDQYENVTNSKRSVKYGQMNFSKASEIPPIVLGIGVSNRLGASEETHFPITCYSFKNGNGLLTDLASPYSSSLFEVTGVYVLQEEVDNQYVFAPLSAVESLIGKEGKVSALEIALQPEANEEDVKRQVTSLFGKEPLKAETRFEQNKTLYFILKSERWAVYAILTLMLVIASFNIIGAMSMLVLDKEKDIAILKTMGLQNRKIKQLFISTGILLSLVGAFIGCFLAFVICLLQQHYGFVKLGSGPSFLIEAYPVELNILDFVLVMCTVVIIAFFASLLPAVRAANKPIQLRLR